MRVTPSGNLPKDWCGFSRDSDNNRVLFHFLSREITSTEVLPGIELYSNYDENVLCTPTQDIRHLTPCSHEEANTRMIAHASDAVIKGHKKLLIQTVDCDVVVLCIAYFRQLGLTELWVAFGVKDHLRCIPTYEIAATLGPSKSKAILFFLSRHVHALTTPYTLTLP